MYFVANLLGLSKNFLPLNFLFIYPLHLELNWFITLFLFFYIFFNFTKHRHLFLCQFESSIRRPSLSSNFSSSTFYFFPLTLFIHSFWHLVIGGEISLFVFKWHKNVINNKLIDFCQVSVKYCQFVCILGIKYLHCKLKHIGIAFIMSIS